MFFIAKTFCKGDCAGPENNPQGERPANPLPFIKRSIDQFLEICLMTLSSAKVDYLYDLMDAARDAEPIYEVSKSLGHVSNIDKKSRGKEVVPKVPHEAA